MSLFSETEIDRRGAQFSDCGKYRYALWRIWDESLSKALCIGLNPSTANSSKNDNTIDILTKVLKRLGYGGFYMMNLFAFITPNPKELKQCPDLYGDNNKWLTEISSTTDEVIFCWGSFGIISLFDEFIQRKEFMIEMFPAAQCFGTNKDSTPFHPRALSYKGILNSATLEKYSK